MNKRYTSLVLTGLMTLSLCSPILFAAPAASAPVLAAPKASAPEAVSARGQRSSLFGVILDIGLASFSQVMKQWSYEGEQTVACPLHTTFEVAGVLAIGYGIYRAANAFLNRNNGGWFRFRAQGEGAQH